MAIKVQLEEDRVREASEAFIDALNQTQLKGFTVDEAICAMLFMAGAALKQRGALLFLDEPLREALPPIALGYETADPAEAWQIDMMRGATNGNKSH